MGIQHSKLLRKKYKNFRSWKNILKLDKFDINCVFNTEDDESVTPIWLAVRFDDVELVRLMIGHGAKADCACGSLMMTPLHMAAFNHSVEMVKLLLKAHAPPNMLDNWNYSPLMYAAGHHEPHIAAKMICLLLESGADPNFGATLSSCTRKADLDNVNRDLPLLRSSYDSDFLTYVRVPMGPSSGTALHIAVQNPHLQNDVIELLLDSGADVDKLNLHGQTPLMGALRDVYYDYHSQVKANASLLLRRGASVNLQDVRGWSSLHYAVQRGSISAMSCLMEYDCDCNLVNPNLESPLWLLLAHGWRQAARYLLCNGCNINQPIRSMILLSINQNIELCRYGPIYPLEYALCNGFFELADLLVDLGCDVTQETWLGRPQNEQERQRHRKLLQRIEQRGAVLQSLQHNCRTTLRATLHQNICAKVKRLSLPPVLKDYICYMPIDGCHEANTSLQIQLLHNHDNLCYHGDALLDNHNASENAKLPKFDGPDLDFHNGDERVTLSIQSVSVQDDL